MFNEVVEADAAGAVEVEEGGWCEELEVRLVPADEVPLEGAGAGVRVVVEEEFLEDCWGVLSLLGLRVEPTSLRKREFMDDIQRGAFLAVAWRGRGEESGAGRGRGRAEGGVD